MLVHRYSYLAYNNNININFYIILLLICNFEIIAYSLSERRVKKNKINDYMNTLNSASYIFE